MQGKAEVSFPTFRGILSQSLAWMGEATGLPSVQDSQLILRMRGIISSFLGGRNLGS